MNKKRMIQLSFLSLLSLNITSYAAGFNDYITQPALSLTLSNGDETPLENCHKSFAGTTCDVFLTLFNPIATVTVTNRGASSLILTYTEPNNLVAQILAPQTTCSQGQTLASGASCQFTYVGTGGGVTSVRYSASGYGDTIVIIHVSVTEK